MTSPADDAWQCLADSCLEHDHEHERRALAELERLGELVPRQRTPFDETEFRRSLHALVPPEDDPRPTRWTRLLADLRGSHRPGCICGGCDG